MGDEPFITGLKKDDDKLNIDSVLRKEKDLRKQRLIENDIEAR